MKTSLAALRGWWASRQGLAPATAPKTIAASFQRTGWLPTSGAPTAYLSIRARVPLATRAEIDRVAMDGAAAIEVHGFPGRPFLLVPPAEVPLALALNASRFRAHIAKSFERDAAAAAALKSVSAQIVSALDECPMSTTEIRGAVTHRDAGSLLTIAQSDLMLKGVVRRFPSDGRIDSTKYQFELRHPDDRPNLEAEGDADAVTEKCVDHFLKFHGPATIDEFVDWAATTKTAARNAFRAIGAEPLRIPGLADALWLNERDLKSWNTFKPEPGDRIAFLPYRDPLVHVRRMPSLLTKAKDVRVLDSRYGKLAPANLTEVGELNHHVVLCGDEVVGLWEYDLKAKAIVTSLWRPSAKLRKRVAETSEEATAFIREQLGDAKLSAVDPPEKRAQRLRFLRGV